MENIDVKIESNGTAVNRIEEAQKAIEAERAERVDACGMVIREALKRYNCELHSHQEYIDGMPKGPSQVIIVGK